MTQDLNLQSLRQAAEAATQGPWLVEHAPKNDAWRAGRTVYEVAGGRRVFDPAPFMADSEAMPNAEFIALANPAAILALLDRLERAEAALYCPSCKGSGEGVGMEGRGPDAYEVAITCPTCDGTGARSPAGAAVPDTHVVVPKEPTPAMNEAYNNVPCGFGGSPAHSSHVWDAMLAAAPAAPSAPTEPNPAAPVAQASQQPVAWMMKWDGHAPSLTTDPTDYLPHERKSLIPLYAAAPLQQAEGALSEIRAALHAANEKPNGPITDTIWMPGRPETLFDFVDRAIAASGNQEDAK